ncbi:glycoside hydrolase family 2 protein [Natrialbaceae archaeon A-chndr2]
MTIHQTQPEQHTTYRSSKTLSGQWTFRLDPENEGVSHDWQTTEHEWPTDDCHSVTVPHAWQELETARDYTGVAWYRRSIDVDESNWTEKSALIRFGAVDYETTLWVNGVECGTNRDGYLPFAFEVTEALEPGENTITVRVSDPEDISEIPHGKQGAPWYQRVSGIWQDVTLEVVPKTRVDRIRATPNLDTDSARIAIDVVGVDEPGALTASVRVARDAEDVATAETEIDGEGSAATTVSIDDPDYWSPESPDLYDVTVELLRDGRLVDRYEDYFGMRSIESRNGQLYLNDEPRYVRGALDQGYYPETLYRPFDEDLFEHEIRTAKELGFNLLRKHIKPAHPDFLELADRLGILVWEEPANPTVHTERSKHEVREQIQGLIERDYNRPSVIIWSLYNEEWGIGNPQGLDEETSLWEDEWKQEYLADLYEAAKSWDPTRLVCDNSGWAHVATDINDYHQYFVSPDRADAWTDNIEWMSSTPWENYAATVTDPEDAPLIVSEFGTWGMCDLPAIEEYYGETPPWFDYDFFDDPIKRPAGVYDRFEETTLPAVFDDWSSLAETWQHREFRSNKDIIEQMRLHDGVAGYVMTEFTDIEWEFNGVLDYRREPKAFHDEFAAVNAPTSVVAAVDHAQWGGESVPIDVTIVNDTVETGRAVLGYELEGVEASFDVDVLEVEYAAFEPTTFAEAATISLPDVESATTVDLTVTAETDTGTVSTTERITVVPRSVLPHDHAIHVPEHNHQLGARLAGARYTLVDDPQMADVIVTTGTDHELLELVAESGTAVLILPPAHEGAPHTGLFDYTPLSEGESWNLVSSLFAHDSPLLDGLGGDHRPDWAFEGLYPTAVATDLGTEDAVHVDYVEGWIANWASPLVTRDHGDGRVCSCTFRLTDQYGEHPTATALLDRLVEHLATDS